LYLIKMVAKYIILLLFCLFAKDVYCGAIRNITSNDVHHTNNVTNMISTNTSLPSTHNHRNHTLITPNIDSNQDNFTMYNVQTRNISENNSNRQYQQPVIRREEQINTLPRRVHVSAQQSIRSTQQSMIPPQQFIRSTQQSMIPPQQSMIPPQQSIRSTQQSMIPPQQSMIPPQQSMIPPQQSMMQRSMPIQKPIISAQRSITSVQQPMAVRQTPLVYSVGSMVRDNPSYTVIDSNALPVSSGNINLTR
jgi:hypothetical protein